MIAKYRVHEVARDLGVPSKDILDLLAQNFDGERKSMTALNEQELSLVLDHYTKQNQVENFDAYFAEGERRRKERSQAAPQPEEPSKPKKLTAQQIAAQRQEAMRKVMAQKEADAKAAQEKAAQEKAAAPGRRPIFWRTDRQGPGPSSSFFRKSAPRQPPERPGLQDPPHRQKILRGAAAGPRGQEKAGIRVENKHFFATFYLKFSCIWEKMC